MRSILVKNSEFLAVYFLIGFSGVTFFYLNSKSLYIIIALMIFMTILAKKPLLASRRNMNLIYLLIVVSIFQIFLTKIIPLQTFLFIFKRGILAYLVLNFVRFKFIQAYVGVIYLMGLISICIHLMALFFPSFLNFIVGSVVPYIPNQPANSFHYNYSIIIHDFWQIDFSRNSGPFWEPGANAGFTVLALAFNLFLLKEKLISYKNVLFIIVIISTLSTSGYLALLFVLFFFFNRTGSLFLKLIFIAVLGFGLNYLIDNLDFLGAKLLTQYEEAESGNARVSRFASALLDLETIKNYPISGYPVIDARQGELTEEDFRTNGVFILLAGWGVVFFFIYFLYTYLGIKKVAEFYNNNQDGNRVAIFFLLLLFLIGFSENYFTRPIFMAFVMMYPFFPTVKFSAVSKIESANLTPFFETEKMSYTNITKSS